MKKWAAILLVYGTLACDTSRPAPILIDQEKLSLLETEINDFIKDNACKPDRTCGTIGFGSKPCGGPWKYLVYSLSVEDVLTLTEKVNEYNALEKELNVKTNKTSDCSLVQPPRVACVEGQCKIVQ
ncbi:MAG: hypothetical protein U0Y10_26775 [Spirosomataceae bacterium]